MKIELINLDNDSWRHERSVPVLPSRGDFIVFQYDEKTISKVMKFRVQDIAHVYENRLTWSYDTDSNGDSLYCAKIYVREVT